MYESASTVSLTLGAKLNHMSSISSGETQVEQESFPRWSVKKWRKEFRKALASSRAK